jgi:capsular polysaccharide biosynthesis protein
MAEPLSLGQRERVFSRYWLLSATVLEGVGDDLGNTQSVVELREYLSVTNPTDTPLLEISATGTTAVEARDKANSAARYLARFITQIETVGNRSPIIVETAVATGSVDESDDSDALEHSGTGKQSVHP